MTTGPYLGHTLVKATAALDTLLTIASGPGIDVLTAAVPAAGNGTTDDRAALAAADTLAQLTGRAILLRAGTYRVASNLTITSALRRMPGATLVPDSGVTITFAGEVGASPSLWLDLSHGGLFNITLAQQVDARGWGETGSAPPLLGAFVAGCWMFKSSAALGSDFGYVCTTTGSPGTWGRFAVAMTIPAAPVAVPADATVYDYFPRSNSAASMGTADSGHVWSALSGTWGISGQAAYLAVGGGAREVVVVESSLANCVVRTRMTLYGGLARFVVRATDNDNYLAVQAANNVYALFRCQAGVFTQIGADIPLNPGPGDVVEIKLLGSAISLYVNGYLWGSFTSSFNQTATKHGLGANGTAATRYDDFNVATTIFARTGRVIFDGNSLTFGFGVTDPYPNQVMRLVGRDTIAWINFGVNGQKTQDMIDDASAQIDPLVTAQVPAIVVMWEITNDLLNGATATAAYNRVVSYCQSRRAAGYRVVVLTCLPRTQIGLPADFETSRQSVNALIRANWPAWADAIADVGADPTIGAAGSQANLTYYQADTIHTNAAGDAVVAGLVRTALTGLI